jgi:prepilin peptidase CpaA
MVHWLPSGFFALLVVWAAVSDLFTMTIPNRLSLLLAAGFIVFALLAGFSGQQILLHTGAGAIVLSVGFALFALGWIGGGDVKVAAAISLWFGFGSLLEYTLLATVYGGVLTLALLSCRAIPLPAFALGWDWLTRLHDRKTGVPYGIALAVAGLKVYPSSPLWKAVF